MFTSIDLHFNFGIGRWDIKFFWRYLWNFFTNLFSLWTRGSVCMYRIWGKLFRKNSWSIRATWRVLFAIVAQNSFSIRKVRRRSWQLTRTGFFSLKVCLCRIENAIWRFWSTVDSSLTWFMAKKIVRQLIEYCTYGMFI